MSHNLKIALIEPEIPGNTGSIARTCVATDTYLYVVGPMPFEITDSKVKRAGLDYWPHLNWKYLDNYEQFTKETSESRYVLTTAKREDSILYHEFEFQPGDIILFGKETMGLSKELVKSGEHPVISLPMWGKTRSLNLANACTTVLYEAYRQLGFPEED
jgi:tRNA (cytidine/uridine-2'-O-)-methyltransferase